MTIRFQHQTNFYAGKVRDVYSIEDDLLVMIASDRISAFDVILPELIPYKGQVLNQIAARMLEACSDICKHWLLASPLPNVSIGLRCIPIPIEIVVRGNLTGHAWRTYLSGARTLCGVELPAGLKEHDFFEHPIITPSTKAAVGHDEDISEEEILAHNLCSFAEWEKLKQYAFALFKRGKELAAGKGLILADTKYEFGKLGDEIILMDEIHTPDSSRYFYSDGFAKRQQAGEPQKQLSKEFVREWLIQNNFMGKPGQQVPEMSSAWVNTISNRYIQLYELLIGESFIPQTVDNILIVQEVNRYLAELRKKL